MTTHDQASELRAYLPDLTRFAAECLGVSLDAGHSIFDPVEMIAPDALVGQWRAWFDEARGTGGVHGGDPVDPEQWISQDRRRRDGIYATPTSVARGMAAALTGDSPLVVDPAAGDGRLLEATIRRDPTVTVVAIERHPAMVLAAAVRIAAVRLDTESMVRAGDDAVIHGDGLLRDRAWPGGRQDIDAVVMNPPYVGEKGQRDRFRAIARRHPDLAERMAARGDLAYLFMHRALDWLRPGGDLITLTPEYWLTATGARGLREDLAERAAVRWMVRAPNLSIFDDAPGHHSLMARFERGAAPCIPRTRTLEEAPDDWTGVIRDLEAEDEVSAEGAPSEILNPARWTPFVTRDVQQWGRGLRRAGTPLAELASDRQGFVSGADRLSARRYNRLEPPPEEADVGDPLFLWSRGELESSNAGERLNRVAGTVLRPVLRGADVESGRIIREPPTETRVLYVDEALEKRHLDVVDHLRPVRPALEQRREVRRGRMPWYRLHWPRDRSEQTGPKLVVPRRSRTSEFALDLSGSAVSSDCTYIVAPEDAADPRRYLITLMVALNRPEVTRYLREFGKTKGELVEFYADPLRRLPLPVERADSGLRWVESWLGASEVRRLESRVEDHLRAVAEGTSA